MQYNVRALSSSNYITELKIYANSVDDVRNQIENSGLLALEILPISNNSLLGMFQKNSIKPSSFSVILFSQELVALLNAGLTIVESLEALIEKEANTSHSILFSLLEGLREGKRFSAVLTQHTDIFSPLYIGIIKAAEGTSDLPRSIARFIDYQTRINKVSQSIISASIYPLILLTVGSAVTLFLIGFVVPRFADVYKGTGRNLPWLSQVLLEWGQFIGSYPYQVLVGIALICSAAFIAGRYLFKNGYVTILLSKIPGVGSNIRIYELSRLFLTLGMLLEGGIPVVTAIDSVEGIVSKTIQNLLHKAKEDVQSGIPLSTAFENNELVTPISMRLLRVGERSGNLGAMLTQSAAFYDAEINRWIERFTRMIEPLLMLTIGLVVGVIVVLLYMPIFDLAESIS